MPRNQKGFTLMELMVVIVIVAILAAVAVPLYINYVRDAQRTEARGAIGAIITGQQAYYQRPRPGGPTYASDLHTLVDEGHVDLTEANVNWTFTVTGDDQGYVVTANGINDRPSEGLTVRYTYTRTGGGTFDDNPGPPGQP
jgi:type IV pilus assembly protein PilE